MSVDVQVVLRHVNYGAAYLWDPPCDSWVSSFASVFYVMAIIVASPVIFLFALDFTSYAIVRTLGIEHAHPASSKSPELLSSVSDRDSSRLSHTKRPSNISLPPPSIILERPQEYFTTPGGANLAGVGLFSPPQSRTPSPPITRKSTQETLSTPRHVSNPVPLGTISDLIQSEAKANGVKGTPPFKEALMEESSNVSPVNAGYGHARNDSSDDGEGALSQFTLRRRKTGMVTPPDT